MTANPIMQRAARPTDGLVFGDNQEANGGPGADTIVSLGDNNTLNGGDGDDTLRGEQGTNTKLHGDDGNDFMRGHIGDLFDGGAGVDDALIDLSGASKRIVANLSAMGGLGVSFGGVTVMNTEKAAIAFGAFDDVVRTGDDALLAIYGGGGQDLLRGGANTDQLAGGLGTDTVHGGDGADKLWGFGPGIFPDYPSMNFSDFDDGAVGDRLSGEGGDDVLVSSMGSDTLSGGDGRDTVSYETLGDGGSTDGVIVRLARVIQETGAGGEDRFISIENVHGSGNNDTLVGSDGDNAIDGDRGDDLIRGGFGADTLTGGNGADVFAYRSTSESIVSGFDRITDFTFADRLDLRGIDANITRSGNQAFKVVDAFDGHAGQLVRDYDSGANETTVLLDTDGDSTPDCMIVLDGDVADDFFIL